MRIDEHLGVEAVIEQVGQRLARRRLDLGLSQAEAAEKAGLGKRTVERLEAGADCQLSTVIRLLRVLGLSDGLETLVPEHAVRPMELLEAKGAERRRARRRTPTGSKGAWRWGDEE